MYFISIDPYFLELNISTLKVYWTILMGSPLLEFVIIFISRLQKS